MWRRIEAEGCAWEARVIAGGGAGAGDTAGNGNDVLEFRALDGLRPPRRVVIPADGLAQMDERALHAAFRQARPIGGDHYGRPGKRMSDAGAP
ncbi:MAG: hypothetical protein DIU52_006235 [bacterium]|jgi:hypothetical protein|nr:MAG: hypothetical protein DIU52_05685 [bacterium]